MTGKGWTTQVAAAAGAAAGTGAAQLGLGYGLGVVVWPVGPTSDDSVWLGSLGWATWIAASATVFGAVIAARLRGAQAPRLGGPWRFALAASAAVGALVTVALVAVPARPAVRADTFAPEMIAGGYAVIGIVLGLVIAYWAVVSRAVAANLIATAGYLWTLAAAGIVVELTLHRESATYLTSWQFAELGTQARYGTIYWPSALLTLLAALIIGMIAAWPSARGGNLGIGTASSGAVGPLLVAASFLMLAPQLTGVLGQLESAYLIAPYAVLSGLAGSALMVAAGRRSAQRRAARIARIHRPAPPAATGKAAVPDPSQTDTPPMGLPQVAATPRQRSGRSSARRNADPARASAADRTPDQPPAPTTSQTAPEAEEARTTGKSGRPGLWGRLRRGDGAKPSAAAEPGPSAEPAPRRSRPSTKTGTSTAGPSATANPTPGSSAAGGSTAGSSAAGRSTPGDPSPGQSGAGRSTAVPSTAPSRAASPAQSRPTAPAASPTQGRPTARTAAPTTPPSQGRSGGPAADPAPARGGTDESVTRPKSSKSTVTAPPSAPPIAKINPRKGNAAESGSSSAQARGKATPGNTTPPKTTPAPNPNPSNPPQDKSD